MRLRELFQTRFFDKFLCSINYICLIKNVKIMFYNGFIFLYEIYNEIP